MKYTLLAFLSIALILTSCGGDSNESKHPYAEFFYPYDTIQRVYGYRDVAHGLDEQFRKVYGVNDPLGKHIIIETYVDRGRLTEIYTISADSLHVVNHTVVNRSNQPLSSVLYKTSLLPESEEDIAWVASKYPGHMDSTMLLDEVKRSFKKLDKLDVLGEQKDVLVCEDTIRWTLIQPFTQREQERTMLQTSYFAKGIGLVEFHGPEKKAHYKLEKIYSIEEWERIVKH